MSELQDPSASTSSTLSDVNASTSRSPLKRTASETLDPSDRVSKRPRDSDQHREGNHTPPSYIEADRLDMIDESENTRPDERFSTLDAVTTLEDVIPQPKARAAIKYQEDMEDELRCGCCTELLYNPVVVSPCGHYFCGSCCVLWVRNGGTNCPACRQPSTSVNHSKILQGFIDVLLRSNPEKQRPEEERQQADEVYLPSMLISIPPPKPVNPEGSLLPQSRSHDPPPDNLARPCPHCIPNNEFGWRCTNPLADPETDPSSAWNLDNGNPPGHAWCGYCDELHAVGAPSTTRCSICATSYCGLSVPHMCMASSLHSAHLPTSLESLHGFIQSSEIYEAFNGNTVEVEALLDWLREDGRGPRGILLDIIEHVRSSSSGFRGLLEEGIFSKVQTEGDEAQDSEDEGSLPYPTSLQLAPPAAADANASLNAPNPTITSQLNTTSTSGLIETPVSSHPPQFTRTCRDCAHDIFSWGLYEWWARERHSALQQSRSDTLDGLGVRYGSTSNSSSELLSESEDLATSTAHGLPTWMMASTRVDCQNGRACLNQRDIEHAKQFNHVIASTISDGSPPQNQVGQNNVAPRPLETNPEPMFTGSGSQHHLPNVLNPRAPSPSRILSFAHTITEAPPPPSVPMGTLISGRIFITQPVQESFTGHSGQHATHSLLEAGSSNTSDGGDIIMQESTFIGSLATPFATQTHSFSGATSFTIMQPPNLPASGPSIDLRSHNIMAHESRDTKVEDIDCISVEQALEVQDNSSSALSTQEEDLSLPKNILSQNDPEASTSQVQGHVLNTPNTQPPTPSLMTNATSMVIA